MAEFCTNSCGSHNHSEFSVSLDDEAKIDPSWILSFFELSVQNGRRFSAGETVQIGWMIVMLRSAEGGHLEVWEPQFDSLPIRWIKGVNNTLRHLLLQRSICDQFECEPEFPSLQQAGTVSSKFMEDSEAFTMIREQSLDNDSGWVFNGLTEVSEEGQFRSLFEVSFHHSETIAFLALPVGTCVSRKVGFIEVTCGAQTLTSKTNDLLYRLSQSPVLV